jgi:predicted phosphohydrolase
MVENQGIMERTLPGTKLVSKGNHDIVVEVDDLLTGKNDVAIKEVKITGNK